MRMRGFAGPWRTAVAVAQGCYCGVLLSFAPAAAEEFCSAAQSCAAAPHSLSHPMPHALVVRVADRGGPVPQVSPRALPASSSAGRSAVTSRHDLMLGRIDADHDDDYLYRLPYGDEVSFPVIQAYDAKLSHRGAEQYALDFGMPIGTPVHAARDGVVVLLEHSHDNGCWHEECVRLANFVVLLHADGTTGEYFHLQQGSVRVRAGEQVRRGEWLARSGNTGYSTAPHLHFGVYRTERDGRTQSVAVRFRTRVGTLATPRTGARYLNVSAR